MAQIIYDTQTSCIGINPMILDKEAEYDIFPGTMGLASLLGQQFMIIDYGAWLTPVRIYGKAKDIIAFIELIDETHQKEIEANEDHSDVLILTARSCGAIYNDMNMPFHVIIKSKYAKYETKHMAHISGMVYGTC